MSQVKVTLRPPPNVDFVHGFPGIPPTGDRPQAAVKGAIEVRVGQQGVKAKWVRIELRKVETLPGGVPNTFTDYVGPSPVNLWQASGDEYAVLHTQDFPFFIRIPESIPPSIALENRAGIKYELVAAVCTKGKKGFLQRRKPSVISTLAPIIIDKHELHSTWPVYCQPERRHLAQEGVNLIVERSRTCYGPGDRVAVTATLRSDSLHTVILRGFELTLKESTIFRAGPFTAAKKAAPLVKHKIIGENKFPVNATLYGGTEHRAELSCEITQRHTTTSINSARYIDITYILSVKALMGTGTHLIMDLPIIVSNWPRNISVEAVKRIGPAMSLSLLPANSSSEPPRPTTAPFVAPPDTKSDSNYPFPPNRPNTTTTQTYATVARPPPPSMYPGGFTPQPTLPSSVNNTPSKLNEFGAFNNRPKVNTTTDYGSKPSQPTVVTKPPVSDTKVAPTDNSPAKLTPRPARPPTNPTHRLTVTNIPDEPSIPKIKAPQPPKTANAPSSNTAPSRSQWPTAQEEKQLYEKARTDVERVQSNLARGPSTNQSVSSSAPVQNAITVNTALSKAGSSQAPWPTAEEEKKILYDRARADVERVQGTLARSVSANQSMPSSPPKKSATTPNTASSNAGSSRSPWPTAEEEKKQLYDKARANVDRVQGSLARGASASQSVPGSPPLSEGKLTPKAGWNSPWPTAEQEKLRLFNEAQAIARKTQAHGVQPGSAHGRSGSDGGARSGSSSGGKPGASSYTAQVSRAGAAVVADKKGSSAAAPQYPGKLSVDVPHYPTAEEEKAALRRYQEAKSAVGRTQGYYDEGGPSQEPISYDALYPSSSSGSKSSPPLAGGPPPFDSNVEKQSEKERFRRTFEAQDAAASSSGQPSSSAGSHDYRNRSPPPFTNGQASAPQSPNLRNGSTSGMSRPPPAAPVASGSRVLSAAEEKAMLKARYDAEDRLANARPVNGTSPPTSGKSSTNAASPPPLAPRPPAEYIQETREEDARVSRYVQQGITPPLDMPVNGIYNAFSPKSPGLELGRKTPGPPPPLQGKMSLID